MSWNSLWVIQVIILCGFVTMSDPFSLSCYFRNIDYSHSKLDPQANLLPLELARFGQSPSTRAANPNTLLVPSWGNISFRWLRWSAGCPWGEMRRWLWRTTAGKTNKHSTRINLVKRWGPTVKFPSGGASIPCDVPGLLPWEVRAQGWIRSNFPDGGRDPAFCSRALQRGSCTRRGGD